MAHTPLITVTAFGKHPAWADHIDSLHARGSCLPLFKSLLYTNGIAPNVQRWTRRSVAGQAEEVASQVLDSDQADADASLIRLDHLFSWYSPDARVVGKLLPSSDQKGRRSYPFVLAVQCEEADAQWVRRTIWPTLAPLAQRCLATPERDALQAMLDDHAASLNEMLASAPVGHATRPDDTSAKAPIPVGVLALQSLSQALAKSREEPPEALIRFLYQIRRVTQIAQRPEDWPAAHLRVPLISGDRVDDMALWQNAARHMTLGKTPILGITPIDQGWIDLILGHADASHFLCLRRSDLPLCTEIAYTLDPVDRQAIHAIIDGQHPVAKSKDTGSGIFSRKPDPPSTIAPSQTIDSAATPPSGQRASKDRNIRIMLCGIFGLVLLIALLLVFLFQNS